MNNNKQNEQSNKKMNNRGSWATPKLFEMVRTKIVEPIKDKFLEATKNNDEAAKEKLKRWLNVFSGNIQNWKGALELSNEVSNGVGYSKSLNHAGKAKHILESVKNQDIVDVMFDEETQSMVMLIPASSKSNTPNSPLSKTSQQFEMGQEIETMAVRADEINNITAKHTKAEGLKLIFATNKLEYFEKGQNDPGGVIGFDFPEAVASVKQELDKVSKHAAAYDDVFADNSSFYNDLSSGGMLDITYAEVGINPIGLDLNGDGVINEDEYAIFTKADKDKTFTKVLESEEFPELYGNWAAKKFEEVYNKGVAKTKTILDKEEENEAFDFHSYNIAKVQQKTI